MEQLARPRTADVPSESFISATYTARRAAHVPGRMGQLVKTAPLTNEANTMLSACATPSSNLAFFCLGPYGEGEGSPGS